MTGKEKIEFLIRKIIAKQEQLIAGDVVILRSDELTPTIMLEEQEQILKKLSDDRRIKYEVSPVYKSIQDIEPSLKLDIAEIATMNGVVSEQELEDELLSLLNYKIKVINLDSSALAKSDSHKVTFNPKTSTLHLGDKECPVPDETLQHYTCKLVFKNRSVPAKELDIIEASGIGNESQRPVYDAMLAINKLINTKFGLPRYLKYNAGKVRINRIYQR